MASLTDFFGYDFETGHLLFADYETLEDVPGVYVIYTEKVFLDIGETNKLKSTIETHPNTRAWIEKAGKNDIFLGFHFDDSNESRLEKMAYLKLKFNI